MKTKEQGISMMVVLAIVAVLAIGGVVAVTVSNNNKAAMEAEKMEMMMETEIEVAGAKAQANTLLARIKSDIGAGVDVSTGATLASVAEVRANLKSAYENSSEEMMAEYEELDRTFAKLETELQADVQIAAMTISDLMSDMGASAEMMVDTSMDTMMGDDKMEGDMKDGEMMEGDDTSTEAGADAGVMVDTPEVGADISVQGGADVIAN